jgi:transcriptional regulator GlxA family with amidase domain
MPATLCGVAFDPRRPAAQRNTPFTSTDLAWLARQFKAHALTTHPMNSELRRLVAALNRQVRSLKAPDGADAAALRLLVCAVILEAARQITAARPARAEQAVAAALAHLREHLHEPVMMDHLARQAGCGRARLFQLFKQNTGLTPNDYLQRLRIAKARELLTTTSQSVTEIAFAAGFASSQYFSRVFRKYTGQMPSEYRRRHRQG